MTKDWWNDFEDEPVGPSKSQLREAMERGRRALGLLARNGDEWTRHNIVGVAEDALADIRAILTRE